jgi:hypothetical protein
VFIFHGPCIEVRLTTPFSGAQRFHRRCARCGLLLAWVVFVVANHEATVKPPATSPTKLSQ